MTWLSLVIVSAILYKGYSLYSVIKEIKQPVNVLQDVLKTQTVNPDGKIDQFNLNQNHNGILYEIVKNKLVGINDCFTTLESLETSDFRVIKKRMLTEKFLTEDYYVVYDSLMPETYAKIFLSVILVTVFFVIKIIRQ